MKPRLTPNTLDVWSANLADIYNSLEGEIIRILIKRLQGGHDDIVFWQAEKLQQLHLFNRDVTKLLAEVTRFTEPQVIAMFEEAGNAIVTDIDESVPYKKLPKPNGLNATMAAYARQAWLEEGNFVNQTLITTNYGRGTAAKAYQKVMVDVAAMFNSGMYTMEQATEKAIQQLAQKGIASTFVDKGGRTWNIENYTRIVMKSTLGNTYNDLRTERMSEYGVHTVLVTSHAGARPHCTRIQGHVVDLRQTADVPEDSEYKSIYDPYWQADYEAPGGHRGINCRHIHIPFIPGANTNNVEKFSDEYNAKVRNATTKQRQFERDVVKYKKNLMVAKEMNSSNADHWSFMVRKRQKALRDLIEENSSFLRRNYKREQVYTPLDTLLKDWDKNAR